MVVIGVHTGTWVYPVFTSLVATGIGITVNVATDLQSNWIAWGAVVLLTAAGASIGIGASRRGQDRSRDLAAVPHNTLHLDERGQTVSSGRDSYTAGDNTVFNVGSPRSAISAGVSGAAIAIATIVVLAAGGGQLLSQSGGSTAKENVGGPPTLAMTPDGVALADASVANESATGPDGVDAPAGSIKVGNRKVKLTLTNPNDREMRITNLRAVNIRTLPVVAGTLFEEIGQSTVSNERMGIDLGARTPVVRELSSDLTLGDPFFGNSSIPIAPHQVEVIELTALTSRAAYYQWDIALDYDTGSGPQTREFHDDNGTLAITGYTTDYQKVFELAGASDGWLERSGRGFCRTIGATCH